MRTRFSPAAESDLLEVKRFIARDDPRAAARFIRLIRDRVRAVIAPFPESGQACDEVALGLRQHPIGDYVVFYRVADEVEIVRVLHGPRDVARAFRSRSGGS